MNYINVGDASVIGCNGCYQVTRIYDLEVTKGCWLLQCLDFMTEFILSRGTREQAFLFSVFPFGKLVLD